MNRSVLEPQPSLKGEGSSVLDRCLFICALVLLAGFIVFKLILPKASVSPKVILFFDQRWENGLDQESLALLTKEFEQHNPGIEIKFFNENEKKDSKKQSVKMPALPDIITFDEGLFSSILKDEILISLDPYIESETGKKAIPLVSFMDLLFYNIDMLKSAGFDRPPKNHAEFFAYAKAVTNPADANKKSGQYGAALALSPAERLGIRRDVFSWIWASGITLAPEGKPYFNHKEITSVLDFLGQLNREALLSPGSFNKTSSQRLTEFVNGKIAMMTASVRDIPAIREEMGDKAFGITVIPGPANYTGKSVIDPSLWYAGISTGCRHPDEAWVFLSFLAEKIPPLALGAREAPGTSIPSQYPEEDPLYSKAWDIYSAADIIQEFSGTLEEAELESIVREELILLFDEKQTAAETAAAIQKRWDAL